MFRFRASLIYINNCPTRCNTKQSPFVKLPPSKVAKLATLEFCVLLVKGVVDTPNMLSELAE
jgi:hypothetical protein